MSEKRRGEEEHENHERWLVSYADFITLMFAFFAVLYATSQKDVEKSKQFQESIKKYLLKGSIGGSGAGAAGANINEATQNNSPIEEPIQTYKRGKTAPQNKDEADDAQTFLEAKLTSEQRRQYILDIAPDDTGVRIVIPSAAIFSGGGDKFKAEAMPFLQRLSELLAQTKRRILIEAHSNAGEQGDFKSTWDFTSARALNTLRFVQKTQKIPSTELAMAALGDSRPVYNNEKKDLNSRIEIILLNPDFDF